MSWVQIQSGTQPDIEQEHCKRGKIRPLLSNIPSQYGLCQGEVDAVKRGPKLNLIKKLGKGGRGGGGGGNPTTLTVSSLVSEF